MRDLVENANFGQGELVSEQMLLEPANLASVEAVEAADDLDGIVGSCKNRCGKLDRLSITE